MKVGLIEVDRFTFPRMTFPNLALMKISAWHKDHGDKVSWCDNPLEKFDLVYQTKVFDETYSSDIDWVPNAEYVVKGGTGYDLHEVLPRGVETCYPDYHLYDGTPAECGNVAYGFLTRGCPRHCGFCIVGDKEGLCSHKVADLRDFWRGQKLVRLLDPNILAARSDYKDLLSQLIVAGVKVDFTQGLDARLCQDSETISFVNGINVQRLHFAWDNPEDDLIPCFEMLDKHLMVKDRRKRIVYVLTNYNSTLEQDLYRVYRLQELGFDPDVRIYDKPHAPREIRRLQRWCNNRFIHAACPRFEDYKG